MKQRIAKSLIITILCLSTVMFLPWVYLMPAYYIARYVVMALTAVAFVLTFSLSRSLSARFVRLLLVTIVCMSVFIFIIPIHLSDISQLAIALVTVVIGMGLTWDERDWANMSYYYTVLLVAVTICNCLYYAGGLYVPERYMFNEGKNQLGAMVAIGASACFFFGMKMKENRTAFWVVSFLALLSLVLIRARSDCFALIAFMLLITAKDAEFHPKWNVKTVLTIIGILLIGYIIYNGFISNEMHTFMYGGKDADNLNDVTSRRWTRNQTGIDILINHHAVKDLKTPMKIPFIHNYPLLRLVRYSYFSLPLLLFYIYFGISTLIEIFKSRRSKVKQVGWLVCSIPLMISFAEPNFPYGPGLVQMFAFLLLGYSLRSDRMEARAEADNADTVLHVCNDLYYSKVHTNLYRELDHAGVKQVVFSPVRKHTPENNIFEGENTTFIYAHILKRVHRLFFFHKVERTVREIEKKVDLSKISCCHATTLFSDGMVAMELNRRYGIPYVVAVRNCDVNAFLRYMPHLWWVHRAVLESAGKVVFIAPALQQRLLKHPTLAGMRDTVAQKAAVVPNGINEFWINNLQPNQNTSSPHHILYAGIFNRNKNLPRLIQAVLDLRAKFPDIHLDVAGDGGDDEHHVCALMSKHSDCITYHGKVTDLEVMRTLYRSNQVLAMPSKSETFGLVYIEAMSQGLSVLWSRGEAIDGMFSEHIGEAVNPLNVKDITEALEKMLSHPENYQSLSTDIFSTFRWNHVAQQYITLYSQILTL
jgi:glycosyltransferase involved in cell wall biosynthesis